MGRVTRKVSGQLVSKANMMSRMSTFIGRMSVIIALFWMNFQCSYSKRRPMGTGDKMCDDGKSMLEVDWYDDPKEYTCYHPERKFKGRKRISHLKCFKVDNNEPEHHCMDQKIEYDVKIPTHHGHRPSWPKFGEYKFVPKQRWLHNVEHGAVVMLYHPCTHPRLVNQLRKIVTGCIRKHIITPFRDLTRSRPLALVAWGCRLLMSHVDVNEVTEFIKTKGLKGPEGDYPKEGQYTHELIKLAKPPPGSDMEDSNLCPGY